MSVIDTITQVINGLPRGQDNALTLKPGDFNLPEVTLFFTRALNGQALTLGQAKIAPGQDTVSVSGSTAFSGYADLSGTITFGLAEQELTIQLKGEFAPQKRVSPPFLSWLSLAKLVIVMDFTGEFGILATSLSAVIMAGNTELPVCLSKMAGGEWSIALTGDGVALPDINQLAGLVGGEQMSSFFPQALADAISGITVGGISCNFNTQTKSVSYFTVTITVTNGWDIAPKIALNPGLTLTLVLLNPVGEGQKSIIGTVRGKGTISDREVPFFVQANAGSSTLWSIGVFPEDKIVLPSFADILSLAGGDDFLNSLPAGLRNIPSLAIYKLQIDFDPVKKTLNLISFSIGTASAWDVLPGYFAVNNLSIAMDINNITDKATRSILGIIDGSFQMGQVFVQISLSRTSPTDDWVLSGGLPPGKTLDLTAIAKQLFEGVATIPDNAPVIAFDELQLQVTTSTKRFQFTAGSRSPWEIIPGKLSIQTFNLTFTRDPAQNPTLSGKISTVLRIDPVDLTLEAGLNDAGKEGWQFFGKTGAGQKIAIGELIAFVVSKFNAGAPPNWLTNITLQDLEASYNTKSGNFSFNITASTTLLDKPLSLTVKFILTNKGPSDYILTFDGILNFGFMQFALNITTGSADSSMSGSWTVVQGGQPVNITDILALFNLGSIQIPKGLDLGLKQIVITYDFTNPTLVLEADSANYGKAVFVAAKNPAGAWQYFFGMAAFTGGKSINLSNLPVIDKLLSPSDTIGVDNMMVTVSSALIGKDFATAINKRITKDYPRVPDAGLPAGLSLSLTFNFGGTKIPLSLDTAGKQAQLPAPAAPTAPGAGTTAAADIPKQQASDGSVWYNLQKSFGPVTFSRVGVKYKDSVLWFLLDASLSLGGLTISVMGLAVGSPVTSFEPQFNIDGLGVDYKNPAVEIGGAFLKFTSKDPNIGLEFGGGIVVKAANFSINAVGSYAELKNPPNTSLFIFASVSGAFGGPPFFFITGFAGGLGYNSRLRLPGQDEIFKFPFVAGLTNPDSIGGKTPTPLEALKKLMGDDPKTAWVTPQAGEIWIAAGIQFTSFELINTSALLVAKFGNDFSLALLGLSRARFPMTGPEIYAFVELQLEAIFNPSEGVISFTAILSPNSYVLDPACHLTGGFAMYFWFGNNDHAGDFVLTLGGYSPYFTPPAWYPKIPRLGFNWSLDSSVTIKGEAYFALTPAAVMAGGALEVKYQSGNLKAWFTAHADIIVWWNPFHFIAGIGLSVGASYKMDLLFTSTTFKVELGADLTLWGPPTGGTVTVHWWVISFTVDFGSSDPRGVEKTQAWEDFQNVLPAKEEAVKMLALEGLAAPPPAQQKTTALKAAAPAAGQWLVRSDKFSFSTNSAVPAQNLYIGKGNKKQFRSGSALNIKPMQKTNLTSYNCLYIIKADGTEVDFFDPEETWDIQPNTGNVPTALWGTGSNADLPVADKQLVQDQLTGFTVSAPAPKAGYTPGAIIMDKYLAFTPILPSGQNPLQSGLSPSGAVPQSSATTLAEIAKIMTPGIAGNRAGIFAALGKMAITGLTNGDLSGLAAQAGSSFPDVPLVTGGQ